MPKAVALAVVLGAVTSWALRDHARYLPDAGARPNPLAASAHGHGGGPQSPAAITGEALANQVGLGVFALHVLLAAVVAVSCLLRRRWSTVDGVAPRVAYAAVVAVVSAAVAAGMAGVLLSGALPAAATLAAAVAVLQYAFVVALLVSAVFGIP